MNIKEIKKYFMAVLLILLEYSEKSNPLKVYKNQLWRGFFYRKLLRNILITEQICMNYIIYFRYQKSV